MREWIFRKVFSDWIPFKWIDNHKTRISQASAFVSGSLLIAQQIWGSEFPWLMGLDAQLATILSILGIELGKQHKIDKGEYAS